MCFCSYTSFSSHSVLPQRKNLWTASSSFFHFSHPISAYDSYFCCSSCHHFPCILLVFLFSILITLKMEAASSFKQFASYLLNALCYVQKDGNLYTYCCGNSDHT
jgi:hypothetical protein